MHFCECRCTWSLCLEGVPDVGVEVVVACEEESATLAEGDTGDATDNLVMRIQSQLLVGPDVEQSARRVIWPSRERLSTREKLDKKTQSS